MKKMFYGLMLLTSYQLTGMELAPKKTQPIARTDLFGQATLQGQAPSLFQIAAKKVIETIDLLDQQKKSEIKELLIKRLPTEVFVPLFNIREENLNRVTPSLGGESTNRQLLKLSRKRKLSFSEVSNQQKSDNSLPPVPSSPHSTKQ